MLGFLVIHGRLSCPAQWCLLHSGTELPGFFGSALCPRSGCVTAVWGRSTCQAAGGVQCWWAAQEEQPNGGAASGQLCVLLVGSARCWRRTPVCLLLSSDAALLAYAELGPASDRLVVSACDAWLC